MLTNRSPSGLRSPKAVLALGALQIVFGLILMLVDMISFFAWSSDHASFNYAAGIAGILGGIFYVITGSMGIHASRKLDAHQVSGTCPLVACLVLSVLSGISTFGLFCFYCTWVAVGNSIYKTTGSMGFTYTYDTIGYWTNYAYESNYVLMSVYLVVYLLLCILCCLQVIATGMNNANRSVPKSTVSYVSSGQFQILQPYEYPAGQPGYGYASHYPPSQNYGQPGGPPPYVPAVHHIHPVSVPPQ